MNSRFYISILFLGIFSLAAPTAEARGLEEKLARQWQQFERARELLIKPVVSRVEWEAALSLPKGQEWTTRELAELRASQEKRMEMARLKAKQRSVFDLDQIRSLPQAVAQFCAQFPKGGMLHIHPSGTLNPATVHRLLEAKDPVLDFPKLLNTANNPEHGTRLYDYEAEWLQDMGPPQNYSTLSNDDRHCWMNFFFLPLGSHPFERFDSAFRFIGSLTRTWNDRLSAWMDFAYRAKVQKVSYVEFTLGFNSTTYPQLAHVLETIEQKTGLIVRVNRAFTRTASAERLRQDLTDLLSLPNNKWIVGIDLLSNEARTPALETAQRLYGDLLREVQAGRSTLRRTMHAGEHGDPRNPRDAMIMGAERLGHGVLLDEDPVALEYAVARQIAIEINLTSNLRLRAIGDIKSHPFLRYLRLGLPVSLSTDDEGILETDINHECEVAISETDISYAELKQMSFNSLRSSFADEVEMEMQTQRLREAFVILESRFKGSACNSMSDSDRSPCQRFPKWSWRE